MESRSPRRKAVLGYEQGGEMEGWPLPAYFRAKLEFGGSK